MVVQKAINNLKAGPKEDKVAVASGIAVSVVVVLLVAWSIFFFRSIARGTQQLNLSGGAQDQFNFSGVKEAQQQLQQQFASSTEDYLQVRNDAAARQLQSQQQMDVQQTQGTGADQFGSPNSTY